MNHMIIFVAHNLWIISRKIWICFAHFRSAVRRNYEVHMFTLPLPLLLLQLNFHENSRIFQQNNVLEYVEKKSFSLLSYMYDFTVCLLHNRPIRFLRKSFNKTFNIIPTVCFQMLVTFFSWPLNEMSAYAQPTHLIFPTQKITKKSNA